MPRTPFVIADENVLNSYGFRLMIDGAKLDQFKLNPIVLWMHKRPSKWSDKNSEKEEIFPIGLAYDLRTEGGKMIADIEFDQKDDFARKIEQKVESGIIRMSSPGIEPLTWTSDPAFLLPGQRNETLLEWQLVEISICDIGSQPTALKLYNTNKEVIELTAGNESQIIPLLKTDLKTEKPNMDFLKQVAISLGKEPDAAQESVFTALNARLELAKQAEGYKTQIIALQNELKTIRESNLVKLVDDAVDKKITADKREFYIELGRKSDIDTLRSVLEAMPEIQTASGTINLVNNPGKKGEKKIEKFEDLRALGIDAIELFKKENPAEYIRLYKAEYGVEPKEIKRNN